MILSVSITHTFLCNVYTSNTLGPFFCPVPIVCHNGSLSFHSLFLSLSFFPSYSVSMDAFVNDIHVYFLTYYIKESMLIHDIYTLLIYQCLTQNPSQRSSLKVRRDKNIRKNVGTRGGFRGGAGGEPAPPWRF